MFRVESEGTVISPSIKYGEPEAAQVPVTFPPGITVWDEAIVVASIAPTMDNKTGDFMIPSR